MEIALILICLAIVLNGYCLADLIKRINNLTDMWCNILSMFTSIEDQLDYFEGLLVTELHEEESAGEQDCESTLRECNVIDYLCPYCDNGKCPFDSCEWHE